MWPRIESLEKNGRPLGARAPRGYDIVANTDETRDGAEEMIAAPAERDVRVAGPSEHRGEDVLCEREPGTKTSRTSSPEMIIANCRRARRWHRAATAIGLEMTTRNHDHPAMLADQAYRSTLQKIIGVRSGANHCLLLYSPTRPETNSPMNTKRITLLPDENVLCKHRAWVCWWKRPGAKQLRLGRPSQRVSIFPMLDRWQSGVRDTPWRLHAGGYRTRAVPFNGCLRHSRARISRRNFPGGKPRETL